MSLLHPLKLSQALLIAIQNELAVLGSLSIGFPKQVKILLSLLFLTDSEPLQLVIY